jgi:hypothetical protein
MGGSRESGSVDVDASVETGKETIICWAEGNA